MIALISLALAADLPTLEVTWNRDAGQARVVAPAGQHVAPDSNVEVMLDYGGRQVTYAFSSDLGSAPFPTATLRGHTLTGTLRAPICKDDGTECRMLSVNVAGVVPDIKRGTLLLSVAAPQPSVSQQRESPYRRDASEDFAVALAEAEASGRPVLLDFTAVWCPPCNLLAAEVLHAPDAEVALSEVLVVPVDVDDPSSWELKDRYDVGGYPTVVAVDGTGTEIDRMLGYDSRETTFAWIADVADGQITSYIPEEGPDATSPEQAAQTARILLERGQDGYEPWLARAMTEPDLPSARVAHMLAEPNADDALWLLDNAPELSPEWVFAARSLDDEHDAVVQRAAWESLVRTQDLVARADYLYVMAEATPWPAAEALYTGAASTLRTALVDDPDRDRAHITFLATLMAKGHDLDGAIGLLDEYETIYPDEPTWAMEAAALLQEAEDYEVALAHADRAVELAWGDNLLRAARTRAELLMALERDEEARSYVSTVLAEEPEPVEGTRIRTHKYRTALAEVVVVEPME